MKKGDTLMKIAKKFYGNSRKYVQIEEANPTLKYTELRVGQKIKIPAAR